jgi:bifunctional non-homologous end joining protein LigD
VDLLRIDGSSLLDIPLLERKRLLEGALKQSSLVRITPYVREPLGSFLSSWRSLGFQSLLYKKANSRYAPNARNDAWFARPMPMN